MKKRVLLLNQTFYPDEVSTSQHLTDLAVDLVKQGYSVTVISDARSYNDRKAVHQRKENHKGVKIHRIKSTAFGKKSKFHRVIDYLTFYVKLFIKLFFMPKFNVVIGLTSPPFISFFGALFSMLKGSRFIHWAMDINPDEAVALGWVGKDSLIHKMMSSVSNFTYQKSCRIVVLDRFMADRINNKGIDSNKITVLPPWPHDDDIVYVPHNQNPFREKYNLNHRSVVMYSGNFSVCHPLDTLLDAALLLCGRKDFIFMFIGGGVRVHDVLEFKHKHNLSNIMFLPYQDRSEMKYSLSAADLHVVIMGEPFVGIVHPCKIYGILCVGTPFVLIGPENCHVSDIIKSENIGNHVAHGESKGLVKIIEQTFALSNYVKHSIREKSQELIKNQFSRKILCSKLINTFDGHPISVKRR